MGADVRFHAGTCTSSGRGLPACPAAPASQGCQAGYRVLPRGNGRPPAPTDSTPSRDVGDLTCHPMRLGGRGAPGTRKGSPGKPGLACATFHLRPHTLLEKALLCRLSEHSVASPAAGHARATTGQASWSAQTRPLSAPHCALKKFLPQLRSRKPGCTTSNPIKHPPDIRVTGKTQERGLLHY